MKHNVRGSGGDDGGGRGGFKKQRPAFAFASMAFRNLRMGAARRQSFVYFNTCFTNRYACLPFTLRLSKYMWALSRKRFRKRVRNKFPFMMSKTKRNHVD